MLLSEVIPFLDENKDNVKIHFAKGKEDADEALKVLLADKFKEWQEYQNNKNFERDYILSLVRLNNTEWLFAGIYRSFGCRSYKEGRKTYYKYRTKLQDDGSELIGKLIVRFDKPFRQSFCLLENYIAELDVLEIRRDFYKLPFPGYDKVCVTWEELYTVIETDDWKKPLQNRKGVYLITDRSNGKLYVGSATGNNKLWRRWKSYIRTGHGGNKAFLRLSKKHIRENFQYTILDTYTASTDDNEIRQREQWWKDVLKTKEFGYNMN